MNIQRDFERLKQRKIDELLGICTGITADDIINRQEVDFICAWLEKNREAATCFPGNVLVSRLRDMLRDGVLDADESAELLSLLKESRGQHLSESITAPAASLPFDDPPPAVEFAGRNFVFTGLFAFGPRAACEKAVRERDGNAQPRVTEKTHYVVIGSAANPDWKHATFGTKIMRAMEIRDNGLPLAIITEDHWVEAVVNTPESPAMEASPGTATKSLEGKRVLFTGELYGVARYTAQNWVEQLGGTVVSSVSKKLDYLVYGDAPGSKLEKALELGIRTIDRDDFLRLVGRNGAPT